MRIRLLPAVLALGFLSGLGMAQAADLIEEPIPVEAPVATSGWYLRGDVGYVFKSHSRGEWKFYNQNPGALGIDDVHRYDDFDLDDAVSFGAGAGYRFNEFVRADATFDYFHTDVDGGTECPYQIKSDPNHGLGATPEADCHYDNDSSADVYTTMANAYIDLPFVSSVVVPYIGAGIGAAYVDYDDLKVREKCPDCQHASYEPFEGSNDGKDDWRFASSLMAGATVGITDNLKLDAGYKYTRIHSGDAFGFDDDDKDAGASGTQYRDNGFNIHTIRAGLRYEFF